MRRPATCVLLLAALLLRPSAAVSLSNCSPCHRLPYMVGFQDSCDTSCAVAAVAGAGIGTDQYNHLTSLNMITVSSASAAELAALQAAAGVEFIECDGGCGAGRKERMWCGWARTMRGAWLRSRVVLDAPPPSIPTGCAYIDAWDPVCGSDGQTYSNAAKLACESCPGETASVTVAKTGCCDGASHCDASAAVPSAIAIGLGLAAAVAAMQ